MRHSVSVIVVCQTDPSSYLTGLRGSGNCSGTMATALTCAHGFGSDSSGKAGTGHDDAVENSAEEEEEEAAGAALLLLLELLLAGG